MHQPANKILDHVTEGERACSALDRAMQEIRRIRHEAGSARPSLLLATARDGASTASRDAAHKPLATD